MKRGSTRQHAMYQSEHRCSQFVANMRRLGYHAGKEERRDDRDARSQKNRSGGPVSALRGCAPGPLRLRAPGRLGTRHERSEPGGGVLVHEPEHATAYFKLLEDLENLFARRVDFVEIGAVRNPYLRRKIEEHQETLSGGLSGPLTQSW